MEEEGLVGGVYSENTEAEELYSQLETRKRVQTNEAKSKRGTKASK
jgi:hypothetical protein